MADDATLEILQTQYFFLDQNFNKLQLACTTDVQRDQLRHDYVASRDNFWAARSREFEINDPIVSKTEQQLKDVQTSMQESIDQLKDIVSVLNIISDAVGIGSKLLTLAT